MKKLVIITLLLATYYVSIGQSELPKFAENIDKIKVKLDMPLEGRAYKNGTGYTLNAKLLDHMPKKVALVSFYTFDPGFTRTWNFSTSTTSGGYIYTTSYNYDKKRNSKGNAGDIAVGFYGSSIDILKNKFKEMGMDLLEPEEFLDTEAKKEFYENYKVDHSKFNDFLEKALNSGDAHDALYAWPEGYNVISIDAEPFANYTKDGLLPVYSYKKTVADAQLWVMSKIGKEVSSINELTTALGVDAVVFFYSTIYVPKENQINLQNVNLLMFGPNPTQLPEGEKKMNYFRGQMYIGLRANVGVPIKKVNKKKPETDNLDFTGYDNVVEAMTNKMKEYFDKAFSKKKK